MKQLLVNCYYDGMTFGEALSFVNRCYGQMPTEKQINAAQALIKDCSGVDWK